MTERSHRYGAALATWLQLLLTLVLFLTGTHGFTPAGRVQRLSLLSNLHRSSVSAPTRWRDISPGRKQESWLPAATVTSADEPSGPTVKKSLVSASALVLLDIAFRRLFKALSISFPSSLAGCGALFASMLTLPSGERIYEALSPGATLLAKWLPLFFVPSLITLPLGETLGSAAEFAKVAVVIVGGFYFTLLTTAGSVLGIRKIFSSNDALPAEAPPLEEITDNDEPVDDDTSEPEPAPKPFSKELATRLRTATVATGVGAAIAARFNALVFLEDPLTTSYLLFATVFSFVFGARLPKKFTKIVHPLVTCTCATWLSAKLLGIVNGFSFTAMLRKYRTGTLTPPGAGDILLFLLGPAVVSLACQMYDRRKLIKENSGEVATAVAVSSFGGLFGTAAAVNLLQIGNPSVRLSLLSRNITSPLAMAIAKILGADVSLAVSMVVVTGLIGANFGASSMDALGIEDPVARGLGIGAAAHGLGTAAFANEEDAFPFAAIAMSLTASACTVLVSIPVIRKLLLQLALGW